MKLQEGSGKYQKRVERRLRSINKGTHRQAQSPEDEEEEEEKRKIGLDKKKAEVSISDAVNAAQLHITLKNPMKSKRIRLDTHV
uniref:Uncharacterized protein n=1 Tax=Knipowitschia caucasica TaxID=637954 RepID=A0AAV2IYY2_KNICA